jgi:uncharacterized membrane-anchored protein YitT (DUF2179 family)
MVKKYWPSILDYSVLALGALIQALGLRLFMIPADLASGGVSGIAQLINHFTGWPIGAMVFLGNAPLFLLGWRFLGGRRFALRTGLAVVLFSLFTDLLPRLALFGPGGPVEKLTADLAGDLFLNSLYGAIVTGTGYGLVYRARASSGGSDILARILSFYRGTPMTQSYLMVDSAVILAAGFVFGWKHALYAIVVLYVSGLVSETILEGSGTVRTVMIVSTESEAIARRVMDEMVRGATILEGTGAFTGYSRPVLYCVITRSEVAGLKAIVHEMDPHAFMVIGVAHEALGEGFRPLKQ